MAKRHKRAMQHIAYVRRHLQTRVDAAGGQKAFADQIGVSPQYVCDCLKGRRDIGKSIANALGYEPVTMYQPTELNDPECKCGVALCKYPLCSANREADRLRTPATRALGPGGVTRRRDGNSNSTI